MTTEPLPSLADLLADADRVEADALALRQAFPRAVARVLHLAARSGSISRRAVSLNTELARAGIARRVALPITEPPVAVVEPLWAALLDGELVTVTPAGPQPTRAGHQRETSGPPGGRPSWGVRATPGHSQRQRRKLMQRQLMQHPEDR